MRCGAALGRAPGRAGRAGRALAPPARAASPSVWTCRPGVWSPGSASTREHCGGAPLRAPLRRSFHAVAAADPQAERLYIALDNWPVHFHPDLRAALPPQLTLLPVPP